MKIKALAILEPKDADRRVYPGQIIDLPELEAYPYIANGLAQAVAEKPTDRAEKRPKQATEER